MQKRWSEKRGRDIEVEKEFFRKGVRYRATYLDCLKELYSRAKEAKSEDKEEVSIESTGAERRL